MMGVDSKGLDQRIKRLLPGYMTMGQSGMGDMARCACPCRRTASRWSAGAGRSTRSPWAACSRIVKVRDGLTSYEDPGWYKHPPGTVADVAKPDELKRDGIVVQK